MKSSSSREDYLIAIYRLTKNQEYINSVSLAKALDVSRASVSEMVKKLIAEELISFVDNQIRLTSKGRDRAKNLISSHRLWEIFMTEQLGMSAQEAHDQAHLLEHITGPTLKAALNRYLDYPTQSPRGNVIWDNLDEAGPSDES